MKIAVYGLGYVGSVTSACLAKLGHSVVGVDIQKFKVDMIQSGRSPIVERGVAELVAEGVQAGRLRATTDFREAMRHAEVSILCIGTPSAEDGSLSLDQVRRVCRSLGEVLHESRGEHLFVPRSTMLPGSCEEVLLPELEQASGRRAGDGWDIAYVPEFLREGQAVYDFMEAPLAVIGARTPGAAEKLRGLFAQTAERVEVTGVRTAEMMKYACNSWHALKVVFGNEIGNLCKAMGVDGQEVMRVFCLDHRLNISATYLKPGFAFGGSCLPKDVRAIVRRADELQVRVPVLASILPSNDQQVLNAVRLIERAGRKKVGILGLSFKAQTDDLRESPIIRVLESLVGKGYQLWVHDENVELSRVIGANREFLEREVPYLESILQPRVEQVLENAEVVVVANQGAAYRGVAGRLREGQILIDLVHVLGANEPRPRGYVGLSW
ncbi:MAG TPA: UDP-glucose/GDP-mannose dehydrogenase family protein [Candidatus Saccharimonadales bacterium]|nr:UDP-glucose/GDP-mannose dehydrogenase family protein [Candidatus Saccharimonadales bacterium]